MAGRRRRPQLVRRRFHPQHALAQREQGKRLQRVVIPVTKDFTQLPSSNFGTITGAGLRDEVEGQSWLLKRLVGNIFCQYVNADGNSDPSQFWRQALVTAGFFVSRNIDSIQGEPDLDYDEYDPMFLDNITNPWIWRRSWILSNPEGNVVRDDFPIANSNYVGDASGPHIDSKVKRRILREQRLFFALTAVGWDGERREVQSLGPSQGEIHAYLGLRIFGKMMRGKNCFGVLNIARGAGGLMTPCIFFPLIALDNAAVRGTI